MPGIAILVLALIYSENMAEFSDSEDPFLGFTTDDLDSLEHAAIVATQPCTERHRHAPAEVWSQEQRHRATRVNSYAAAVPAVQENVVSEDDYTQFNVDDADLLDNTTANQEVALATPDPSQSHSPVVSELRRLRAEITQLKFERDKFETKAYSQDGKLDHLHRALNRALQEHESALARLKAATESEKTALRAELGDKDRRLAALTAQLEFQKNELVQIQQDSKRVKTEAKPEVNGAEEGGSPRKPARAVKGSGVKSPESKSKIGQFSARAFGKEGVVPAKYKKRKREDDLEPVSLPLTQTVIDQTEVNRSFIEEERALWTTADARFEDILAHQQEDYPISSILIHEITTRAAEAQNETDLANIICVILCQQWNKCLMEETVRPFACQLIKYSPLIHIQSLLDFLLLRSYETCKYCLTIAPSPVQLSQSSIELHASKRIYNKDTPQIPYEIIAGSLAVLYTIACGLPLLDDISRFWEMISVNFVVMTMHTKQLVRTILGMSKLLETSVTHGNFGPRGPFEEEDKDGIQRDAATLVLDKLTSNLVEPPRSGSTVEEVHPRGSGGAKPQLWELRAAIIHTLWELVSAHENGSKLVHDTGFILPRVITLLANEMEYYYSHPLDSENRYASCSSRSSYRSVALSKACVRLLHAIVMRHSPDTLSHYLSPFAGAQQAHNVAMTRLSFGGESEDVFVDVADLARDLLEAAVSPEEGDGIWSLFQWSDEDEEMDVDEVGEDLAEFLD